MVKPNPGYDWERDKEGKPKRPWGGGLPKQVKIIGETPKHLRKPNPKMKRRGKTKKSSVKLAKKYFKGGMV